MIRAIMADDLPAMEEVMRTLVRAADKIELMGDQKISGARSALSCAEG
jgi:hypothetical protein